MNRIISVAVLFAFAFSVAGLAGDYQGEPKAAPVKHAGFDKLKKLEGRWFSLGKDGKATDQLVSVFKVTAGGSAVQETIFPGTPYEMVTVYHLDGKDLVLTHYCAARNQPRMKADPDAPANTLAFTFIGGANIDPTKDMHMHEGSMTFIDDDTVESNWLGWSGGKAADDHKLTLKLIRKK
jgi:hypothetical protein